MRGFIEPVHVQEKNKNVIHGVERVGQEIPLTKPFTNTNRRNESLGTYIENVYPCLKLIIMKK
jgi:hypothetical protein